MHIPVGTGTAARTSLTVPMADFRELGLQPGCAVLTPFFHVGLHVKPAMPSDAAAEFGLAVWDSQGCWKGVRLSSSSDLGSVTKAVTRSFYGTVGVIFSLVEHSLRDAMQKQSWHWLSTVTGSALAGRGSCPCPDHLRLAGVRAGFPWD